MRQITCAEPRSEVVPVVRFPYALGNAGTRWGNRLKAAVQSLLTSAPFVTVVAASIELCLLGASKRELSWLDTAADSKNVQWPACSRPRVQTSRGFRRSWGFRSQRWSVGGLMRLQAVITTAAMDEARRSAWCREQRIFPPDLG